MKDEEFEKLNKDYPPQKILNMHCNLKISLSPTQITKLIKKRDKKIKRGERNEKKKNN